MISLKQGKEIAIKEFSEFPIGEIIDIGEMWAFCYDSGEPPVPGALIVTVSKEDGKIGYLPIPPIKNLDIIENGKIIYSAEQGDIMTTYEMVNEKTPCGGDYSEIFYFDDNGNYIEAEKATKFVIRECQSDGNLIKETYGTK